MLWRWRQCALGEEVVNRIREVGNGRTNRFVTYRSRIRVNTSIDNIHMRVFSPPPCFCLWFIFVFARTCCFFNTSSESRVECIRSDTTAAANIKASSLPVRVAFSSRTTQLDCHDRGNVECRLDVYADTSLEAPPVSYACNSSLTFCRRERMDAWTWCCFSPPGYPFPLRAEPHAKREFISAFDILHVHVLFCVSKSNRCMKRYLRQWI